MIQVTLHDEVILHDAKSLLAMVFKPKRSLDVILRSYTILTLISAKDEDFIIYLVVFYDI